MKRLLLGPLAALLLVAAPADAATSTLTAARAADRDCTSRLQPGRAGVATTTVTAPAEGTIRAQLLQRRGAGDWDLAAFDSAGTLIAGSKAFRSNELVHLHLRKGARVTLQACRVAGRGRAIRLRTDFARFDFESLLQKGKTMLVDVPLGSAWQMHALEHLGLDVTHDSDPSRARIVLYGDEDRALLEKTGLKYDVVRADLTGAERAALARDRRWAQRVGRSPLPSGRTTYRTYEDVQQELKDMQAQHPDLVRGFTLKTKTFEGRDIQAVEIASDVNSGDDGRPVLFLNGIHHAREWPATEVLMEFAWDVLKNHGTDPQLARILRDVRIVLQPYTNVDGFLVSRAALGQPDPDSDAGFVYSLTTGVVIMGGSFGYKRKNCNPHPAPYAGQPCELNIGTDNNRNYPHTWGGGGASTNPNSQSYRGPGPGSEPETKAVQELHLTLNAPVLLSMHNIAAKVLRPPGTEAEGFSPDEAALKELGRRMAEPAGYTNEYGWQLYDVTGGTKDWAYAVTGSFGYTIETGPANGDFHGSYQSVVIDQYEGKGDTAGRGMREALINAALWTREESQTSRITGRAPAGRTLRITKALKTQTSPVCAIAEPSGLNLGNDNPTNCIGQGEILTIDEKLDITTVVPGDGHFTWWLNPSTRPYATAPETYHLTCEQDGQVLQETDVVVARGQTLELDLPCGGTLPARKGGGSGGADGDGTGPGTGTGTTPGGTTLKIGRVKRTGKRLKVTLTARGGTLRALRVKVRRGKRTVGTAKLKRLSGTRTVTVKSKRKLRRGRYTVSVSAKGLKAVKKTVRR